MSTGRSLVPQWGAGCNHLQAVSVHMEVGVAVWVFLKFSTEYRYMRLGMF